MIAQTQKQAFCGDSPAAAAQGALADRRELALVAVERTRMPMVVCDARAPDCPVVLANQAFLELTGYSAEEVLHRNCRFMQGPNTSQATVNELHDRLSRDENEIEIELLNYRKDGSSFWNQLLISAVRDDEGTLLYYFSSQKDVTTRRRAEELERTERLLLQEVDHRSMNALALVQSIIHLSNADDPQFAALIAGRVDALARAHRLLSKTSWSGGSIAQLVHQEVPVSFASRVRVDGPDMTLPPVMVQPLSLVLHELFSNAIRHGALSDPDGGIELSWKGEDELIQFEWREVGAVPVHNRLEPGFGIKIIKGVAEGQLGGSMTMRLAESGLTAVLTLPLKHEERRMAY